MLSGLHFVAGNPVSSGFGSPDFRFAPVFGVSLPMGRRLRLDCRPGNPVLSNFFHLFEPGNPVFSGFTIHRFKI